MPRKSEWNFKGGEIMFIVGFLFCIIVLLWSVIMFLCGFAAASWDASQRLKGKKHVDEYWRNLGMRDPEEKNNA